MPLQSHYDSAGQDRLLRMMGGAYIHSSCGSNASTSRLPLMAFFAILLHTNPFGFSWEMQV
jgi:hypothetical protein